MTTTRHTSESQNIPAGAAAPQLCVVTFGCQMNKYDSSLVEGRFRKSGYGTTSSVEDADVVIFNTCSVRDHAEERTWSWVGELKQLKKRRPDMVIGLMGCMAQRVEEEAFKRAAHIDLVAGTRQFQHLPQMVEEVRSRRADSSLSRSDERVAFTDMAAEVPVDRTGEIWTGGRQAFLAVMRGCALSCTYCVVPMTRGGVQSRSIPQLVQEARWHADQGVKVLTLLGQTVNSYGEDFSVPLEGQPRGTGRQGREGLGDLLRALQEVPGLERIRMITLHPSYATRALAEAMRDCDKVDRFLPLPAQAGSDPVLKRMKRAYNLDLYRKRADTLRSVLPDLELGSDWIVGFSGETEEDFVGSQRFLEEQQFIVNYIFKYDERPLTKAAGFPDDVPEAIKKERHQRLMETSERVQRARFEQWCGRTEQVFLEAVSPRDANILQGRSVHGLSVSIAGGEELLGTKVPVILDECTAYGFSGRLARGTASEDLACNGTEGK